MKNILAISLFLFSHAAFALDCEDGVSRLSASDESFSLWCEKSGVRQGPLEVWSVEKGLVARAQYRDGMLEGRFLRYGDRGEVVAEGFFHKGELDGEWVRRYPNGRVKDRGAWRGGEPAGLWRFYSESGYRLRDHDFSEGASLVPHWQLGFGISRAEQMQGDYTSGVLLLTRCLWCGNTILVPRLDIAVSMLKFQEDTTRAVGGAHLSIDFSVGPALLRPMYGLEYLNSDHLENAFGVEITRVIGRSFRSTDFQPFVRYLHVDLGRKSDIDLIQAGLWLRL